MLSESPLPICNVCGVQWLPWLGWRVIQLYQLLLLCLILALSLLPWLFGACRTPIMVMVSILRSIKSMLCHFALAFESAEYPLVQEHQYVQNSLHQAALCM